MATPGEINWIGSPGNVTPEGSEFGAVDRMVALAAGLGMFLASLDIALNVALPSLTQDFDTDLQTVQWVIVAFVATRAGLVLGAGSFGDRFGLKPMYLFGAATYLLAMVLIAFSPNLGTMVGFRVIQALSVGCLFAVSPAIAAKVFPAGMRGLGMGFAAGSQAFGMLAGTLGAGLLVRWFDWESVFLARIPFAALAFVIAYKFMKKEERQGSETSFDIVGAVSLIGALLGLVIGLRLGRSEGWTSPEVLALLSAAPVLLIVFWTAEKRAEWPVLPLGLLRVRGFAISALCMFLAHLGVFVIWFIFPFYIADNLGKGPFTLGVMLAVMAFLNTGFSGVGGWLSDHVGTFSVGVSGLAVMALGLLYMGFLSSDSGLAQVGLRIAVVGIGLGLFQAAAYTLMLGSVPQDRFGTAAATLSLAQAMGTVLSVAVIGGIFGFSNDHNLSELASSALTVNQQETQAFMQAFQDVFWLGAGIAAVGAVVFVFSWQRRPG